MRSRFWMGKSVGSAAVHQSKDLAYRGRCFIRCESHPLEKERHPGLPITFGTDITEASVVLVAVAFEKQTQVEEGLREKLQVLQEKSDQ